MNRGLEHSIEHYEKTIERFKKIGTAHLLSFVGPMENTLRGLYKLRGVDYGRL